MRVWVSDCRPGVRLGGKFTEEVLVQGPEVFHRCHREAAKGEQDSPGLRGCAEPHVWPEGRAVRAPP